MGGRESVLGIGLVFRLHIGATTITLASIVGCLQFAPQCLVVCSHTSLRVYLQSQI